jgi:hypothetical protein
MTALLDNGGVLMHPFVLGELVLGMCQEVHDRSSYIVN